MTHISEFLAAFFFISNENRLYFFENIHFLFIQEKKSKLWRPNAYRCLKPINKKNILVFRKKSLLNMSLKFTIVSNINISLCRWGLEYVDCIVPDG